MVIADYRLAKNAIFPEDHESAYIDPLGGEKLKDGLIRARRIEVKEAYKLYGKS